MMMVMAMMGVLMILMTVMKTIQPQTDTICLHVRAGVSLRVPQPLSLIAILTMVFLQLLEMQMEFPLHYTRSLMVVFQKQI